MASALGLPEIHLAPEVRPMLRLGILVADPVSVGPSSEQLGEELEGVARSLRAAYAGAAPSEIPPLAPARELYRSFGVDPTRTRPSSEALVRRALQGRPLPRLLNAVDVSNLCSMAFFLPIGLYDAGKLRGAITVRRGLPGESYPGIRKGEVHLEGRPVLADRDGPFGNPTSDSLRAAVAETTRSLLMVVFAPAGYPTARLESHLGFARERMERYLGGSHGTPAIATAILPAP
jgi:DNA/RNA-binding domain of Phe-tRNA-synthetase-like protein